MDWNKQVQKSETKHLKRGLGGWNTNIYTSSEGKIQTPSMHQIILQKKWKKETIRLQQLKYEQKETHESQLQHLKKDSTRNEKTQWK